LTVIARGWALAALGNVSVRTPCFSSARGSRTKDSQTRGAIGGAAGAIIGGIAGGVKGAVLGAIIGGAAGVGTVYIEGNKELILEPGTEMVIRTERSRAR